MSLAFACCDEPLHTLVDLGLHCRKLLEPREHLLVLVRQVLELAQDAEALCQGELRFAELVLLAVHIGSQVV